MEGLKSGWGLDQPHGIERVRVISDPQITVHGLSYTSSSMDDLKLCGVTSTVKIVAHSCTPRISGV